MTVSEKLIQQGSIVIWPEETEDGYGLEHAILVQPYSDSVSISQRGDSITVPSYALRALIRALRDMEKVTG